MSGGRSRIDPMKIRICKLLVAFIPLGLASPPNSTAADLVVQSYGQRVSHGQAGSHQTRAGTASYFQECSVLNVVEPGSDRYISVCHPVVQLSPLMRGRPGSGSNGAEFSTGVSFRAQ